MVNKYPDIVKYFGTPINNVPKPKIPFKAKTWHYVAGGVILALSIYGCYTLVNKIKGDDKKTNDPLPDEPNKSLSQKPIITVPFPKQEDTTEVKNDNSTL
jgi:hypothetical protein